jgi:predicted transcriptional regulator
MATTVRLDDRVAAKLRELAKEEHRPIGQVVQDAVDQYQKEKFWREAEASVARLRADPDAWQDYQEEIRLLEGGSMDGLEDEEPYYTEAEVEEILGRQARTQRG